MFKKIVVPLDGSETARSALEIAFDIALASGASIGLCSVVDAAEIANTFPQAGQALAPWIAQVRDDAAAVLTAAAEQAKAQRVETTTRVLHAGPAAAAIVAYAQDIQADAIVIATHGRSGFARKLMGSVARDVLAQAQCAVITIRAARLKKAKAVKAEFPLAQPA